jgi:hypothetical protein
MNNQAFVVFGMVCIGIMVIAAVGSISSHEQVHVFVNNLSNCSSEYRFSLEKVSVYTECGEDFRDLTNFEMAHVMNEVVAYNTQTYLFSLLAMISILITVVMAEARFIFDEMKNMAKAVEKIHEKT